MCIHFRDGKDAICKGAPQLFKLPDAKDHFFSMHARTTQIISCRHLAILAFMRMCVSGSLLYALDLLFFPSLLHAFLLSWLLVLA